MTRLQEMANLIAFCVFFSLGNIETRGILRALVLIKDRDAGINGQGCLRRGGQKLLACKDGKERGPSE